MPRAPQKAGLSPVWDFYPHLWVEGELPTDMHSIYICVCLSHMTLCLHLS